MEATLVTAGSFWDALEAYVAKAQLEASGVPCAVADEHVVGMDWTLCNAIGGIKVQVRQGDLERARAILDGIPQDISGVPELAGDPFEKRSLREEDARAAFHVAVWSFLFFPISIYALYLVMRGALRGGRLDKTGKRQMVLAVCLVAVTLSYAFIFMCFVLDDQVSWNPVSWLE